MADHRGTDGGATGDNAEAVQKRHAENQRLIKQHIGPERSGSFLFQNLIIFFKKSIYKYKITVYNVIEGKERGSKT